MTTATPKEIADWPAPNYENPVSRHGLVTGLTIPTMSLVVIFMGIRFYGKGVLRRALGLDDWIMLAAAVTSIPVSAMAMASLNYGLGLHIWDTKPEWTTPYYKMAFATDILFPITCSLTKCSLCLTYLRLFPSRTDRTFCYTINVFLTLYTLSCVLLMLFQCTPIRGYWNIDAKQHCIDIRTTLITIAALNSLSDFLVYLWPAKPLWSLQLPLKQRLGLIFVFAIGCSVCVCGALRMYFMEVYFTSYDLFWHAAPIYAVIALEMNLGIICGCLSGVKPVLSVIFPRIFGSSYKTNTDGTRPTYGHTTNVQSFPFQPLSDVSNSKDRKFDEYGVAIEVSSQNNKDQGNYAWASSSADASSHIPRGAIAVNQSVVVHEETRDEHYSENGGNSVKSGAKSDGGSEEWIIDDITTVPRK
ncbi:hypothetical protein CC78DRAFT_516787 [Lojkania enalia]|uniref:Rhodopsin domain-containing protein n=1 Tax=Lojkania enalia TaxID=147567 RepID=A0A9P4KA06_9PLEO|nr:hypothetical protein CC78DRAFT_516787 [Didymosphaeria enalia]